MRFSSPDIHQIQTFPGWGSLQRSPNSQAGGELARCPLPKNPLRHSRPFGPRARPPFVPRTQHTHVLIMLLQTLAAGINLHSREQNCEV